MYPAIPVAGAENVPIPVEAAKLLVDGLAARAVLSAPWKVFALIDCIEFWTVVGSVPAGTVTTYAAFSWGVESRLPEGSFWSLLAQLPASVNVALTVAPATPRLLLYVSANTVAEPAAFFTAVTVEQLP